MSIGYKTSTPGVGKLTLHATDTIQVEFTTVSHSTDQISASNSMKLPANVTTTIDVPTLKFQNVSKTIAGVADNKTLYLQFQSASDAKKLKVVEH